MIRLGNVNHGLKKQLGSILFESAIILPLLIIAITWFSWLSGYYYNLWGRLYFEEEYQLCQKYRAKSWCQQKRETHLKRTEWKIR